MKIRQQNHENDTPNDQMSSAASRDDDPTSKSVPASDGSGFDGQRPYTGAGQSGGRRSRHPVALFTAAGLVTAVIGGGIGAAT